MIAFSGVRSSWLMLARKTLLCRLASCSARFRCSSSTIRFRRSSAVTNALISCWVRFISSPPKPGVNGPARTTRVPEPDSPATGSTITLLSTSDRLIRLTPRCRRGSRRPSSTTCAESTPRLAVALPAASNWTAAAPPTRRVAHSSARLASASRSSFASRSSMKARRPSSSDARHCRRSQVGGAKLA